MSNTGKRSFLCRLGLHQWGKGIVLNPFSLISHTKTIEFKCTRKNCNVKKQTTITYGSI